MSDFHQTIPRPADARRRTDTPWDALDGARRGSIPIEVVRASFLEPDLDLFEPKDARAAVLVALVERAGEACLLLTRRALSLERDPGLISLPGGYVETGELEIEAALREAEEEIGLARDLVEPLSFLGVFERARSEVSVAAFLGIVTGIGAFSLSSDEVHELFEIPLAALMRSGSGWQEVWGSGSKERVVRFFADREVLGDNLIWGLTASIIWTVLERVVDGVDLR